MPKSKQCYHELPTVDRRERYQISTLFAEGYSKASIVRVLRVHPAIIGRELIINSTEKGYHPEQAQQIAADRKQSATKYTVSQEPVMFIGLMLEQQWSPQQISSIGKKIHLSVSHDWIYRSVAQDKAKSGELYKHLRQGHKRYRKGKNKKHHSPIFNAVSIDECSKIVDSRERF